MRYYELNEGKLTRRDLLRAIYRHSREHIDPDLTWDELQSYYSEVATVLRQKTVVLYRGLASEDDIYFDVRSDDFQDLDEEKREEVAEFAKTIRFNDLGLYWTWDKECAVPGGSLGGGSGHEMDPDIIIEIEVNRRDIDIVSTLYHNLTVYQEEKEIRLFPHRDVRIRKVYPGCLDLPFPTVGNTGSEGWDDRASTLRDLEPHLPAEKFGLLEGESAPAARCWKRGSDIRPVSHAYDHDTYLADNFEDMGINRDDALDAWESGDDDALQLLAFQQGWLRVNFAMTTIPYLMGWDERTVRQGVSWARRTFPSLNEVSVEYFHPSFQSRMVDMKFREVNETLLTEAKTTSFRLHPSLNPDDYQITNSLRDAKRWRARVHVGEGLKVKPGDMDEVGYVMINIHDNTIIPIPRADEHHRGYDLVYDFAQGKFGAKDGISPNEFVPVWQHGKNYLYENDPKMLEAVKRHLAYGGRDGVISMHGKTKGLLHLSDYVARNGDFSSEPGQLAPEGQRIYEALRSLAVSLREVRGSTEGPKVQPVFKEALSFIQHIAHMTVELGLEWDYISELPKTLRALQKERDVQGLEEMFFGFHGVKNKIHARMKNPNSFQIDGVKSIWGDVDYAVNLLADF